MFDLKFLRKPFVVLLTVPAGVALSIACWALILVFLERYLDPSIGESILSFMSADTASSVLSLIAGGAMSALTLTYSIVLVVFTLAAGTLAPRMLQRFTTDLVNQMTAGIFGGTFLYAMVALSFIDGEFVPDIAVIGAEVLAVICVMQLIYFVRHVSRSVTIDDEIAGITARLKTALDSRERGKDRNDSDAVREADRLGEFDFEMVAGCPGYLVSLDEERLIALARKHDTVFQLQKPKGVYTLTDDVLIKATNSLDDEAVEAVQRALDIQPSRSQNSPVEFSINLLVEIALRALSPGVNDTFTAIATVDSLSSALAETKTSEDRTALIRKDDEGEIRLLVPELSMRNLINQAFHPLRQASGGNILMAICLANAYARLYTSVRPRNRELLKEHARLLICEIERHGHLEEDVDSVIETLPSEFRNAERKRRRAAATPEGAETGKEKT